MALCLPLPQQGRLLLGIDTCHIHRPESHTSPERTYVYASNLPKSTHSPAYPGWGFSSVVVLPQPASSWMYVLDVQRVHSEQTASNTGGRQLRELLPQLPVRPLLLADRHYASTPWVEQTGQLECDQLLRAQANWVLYRPAPPSTGKRGREVEHGARFKSSEPGTHSIPDRE